MSETKVEGNDATADDAGAADEELSQVMRHRREKLAAIRERGIEPFVYNFEPTGRSSDAREAFESAETAGTLDEGGQGPSFRIGGRIVGWRDMGRSVFAHVEDAGGKVQLYFRKNVIGGPGAFVIRAHSFDDYAEAIRLKLLREISFKFIL